MEWAALLDFRRQFGVVERGDGLGFARIEHPDQARTLTRQRHQGERPARRVEFRRSIVMRPAVGEANGERDLPVAALVDADAGGLTAERAPAIGADDQRRTERVATLERHHHFVSSGIDADDLVVDHAQYREALRFLLERRDQMAVLDIVAEGFEPDLAGVELHLGRAPQPAGIVDNAYDAERGGLRFAQRPDAEGIERGDRAGEQGGGTIIRQSRALSRQHGCDAGAGKRNRRRQPGRAAAHDDGVRFRAVAKFVRHQ